MTAEEILRHIYADRQLSAIRQKIESGKATFTDTAAYNERVSELIGSTLSALAEGLPAGERERLCTALLRGQYEDTNRLLADVQSALDEALGLHLAPQKAAFPAERVQQVAQSLEDQTVPEETIRRRAHAPVANVSKAFHDAYMRENARFRDKAGIKCYLVRESHGECCPWCQAIVGRYVYGDHPSDIFRRHDNCTCTVTFENGRERQDVWSKRTWSAPDDSVQGFEPTTFSQEQAEEMQAKYFQLRGFSRSGNLTPENSLYRRIEFAENNPITANRAKEFKLFRVTNSRNNIYVSEGARRDHIKPKELHRIDMHLSEVYKMMGIESSENLPAVYIVDGTEMATGAAASYNAILNILYINKRIAVYNQQNAPEHMDKFSAFKDDRSSYVHEMYHWLDSEKFRRKHGEITIENYSSYLEFINREAKKHLDKLQKKGYNIDSISQYASDKYKEGQYFETYTEYRTDNLLKR